jgi:hypothetical protein
MFRGDRPLTSPFGKSRPDFRKRIPLESFELTVFTSQLLNEMSNKNTIQSEQAKGVAACEAQAITLKTDTASTDVTLESNLSKLAEIIDLTNQALRK